MKKKSLIIGAVISTIIIITLGIGLYFIKRNLDNSKKQIVVSNVIEENENKVEEDTLVAIIDNEEVEEDQIYVEDAADITRNIQDMDINVGTINIPKTSYISDVYCKQDANKMEEMPCMLYTNNGPNKPGVTILVGHNRENGTLFSNNNMLEENDEFYFKDYEGIEKKYIIYSKFVTDSTDVSFYNTPSNEPIIAMQCCLTARSTDKVLIVMAKAEE